MELSGRLWLVLIFASLSCGAGEFAIVFTDVTERSGILPAVQGIMGHGGAWGDVDGDGKPDLFVGGFCDRPNSEYKPAEGPVGSRLFRNLGSGKFERVTPTPAEFFGRASGAVFADLDNSGRMALYVANNAKAGARARAAQEPQASAKTLHSLLFRNDGGTLVDISAQSGACPDELHTARNVGVFDYDGDGLLDLFIVEDKFTRDPRSVLLRNVGGLKFENVSAAAGLPNDIFGLGLAVADLNGDGRPDFFVPHSNRLFLSQPGNKYREATELRELFKWKPLDGEDWPCGATFVDLNRDGLLDLVLSIHFKTARNKVFLNGGLKDGVPQFRDITEACGLGEAVPNKCPHVEVIDFDNDGWPDVFLSAAWVDETADGKKITPLIFHHEGVKDGIPHFKAARPLKAPMVYYPAAPSCDYDGDGRVDLFLVNWYQGDHCHLLHNESPARHWLDVKVTGKGFNRMGIGAQISVYRAGASGDATALLGFQEISIGYGYASGQVPVCHFGLNELGSVDLVVKLPNGKMVRRAGVKADQVLTVEE